MQSGDDDPLSRLASNSNSSHWVEGGTESRDSTLLKLGTGVEDTRSNRSVGGGEKRGGHLSDTITLENAQQYSTIDSRSVVVEGSRYDTSTNKSFGQISMSSSAFNPFGNYTIGQKGEGQQHHVEQNVDDKRQQPTLSSLKLPFQHPRVQDHSQQYYTSHTSPSPPPLPSMYASQPGPLIGIYNDLGADVNYPSRMSASFTNVTDIPAYDSRSSEMGDGLSSFQRSAHYQSFSGFGSPGSTAGETDTCNSENEMTVRPGRSDNMKKRQQQQKRSGHLIGGNRSLLNIHDFHIHTYTMPTLCDGCGNLLMGLVSQGYNCIICGMNVHDKCQQLLCSPKHKCYPPSKIKLSSGICDGEVGQRMVGACEILKSASKPQVQTELQRHENKILHDPCDEVWHQRLLSSNQGSSGENDAVTLRTCTRCTYIVDNHIASELRSAGYHVQRKSKEWQLYQGSGKKFMGSGWQGQAYPPMTQNEAYPSNVAKIQRHEVSEAVYSESHGASATHSLKYHQQKKRLPPPHCDSPVVTSNNNNPNVIDDLSSSLHDLTNAMDSMYESSHRTVL